MIFMMLWIDGSSYALNGNATAEVIIPVHEWKCNCRVDAERSQLSTQMKGCSCI